MNRDRQRRFQKRHPEWEKNRREVKKRRAICNGTYTVGLGDGRYRTFELADPRDENLLPHVLGYGEVTNNAVWEPLWSVRNASRSRWAQWFRELDALYLEPKEIDGWSVGLAIPVNDHFARSALAYRRRYLNLLATGSERIAPEWLLRVDRPLCVGRVRDGLIERFSSIKEAHAATAIPLNRLRRLIDVSGTRDGWTWFDD
jgi:hypothetical protein